MLYSRKGGSRITSYNVCYTKLLRALEVKNMVQVAQCIAEAALWRENSIGAHYRADFPQAKRPGWQQHSRLSMDEGVNGKRLRKSKGLLLALRGRAG